MRRLYSAVYVRRLGFAATCTSSTTPVTSRSMGSSPLALISNFGGRDYLTHADTEGTRQRMNLPRFRGHCRSHGSAIGVCHGQTQAAGVHDRIQGADGAIDP